MTGLPAVQDSAAGSPSRMALSPKHCPFFSSVLLRLPIRRDDDSTIPAGKTLHISPQAYAYIFVPHKQLMSVTVAWRSDFSQILACIILWVKSGNTTPVYLNGIVLQDRSA